MLSITARTAVAVALVREDEGDIVPPNVGKLKMKLRDRICPGGEGSSLAGGAAFVRVFLLLILTHSVLTIRKEALDVPWLPSKHGVRLRLAIISHVHVDLAEPKTWIGKVVFTDRVGHFPNAAFATW